MIIDGIQCTKEKNYCLFIVEEFSEQLKEIVRKYMASICYGDAYVNTGSKIYSYKNTIKEFLKRYEEKKVETQEGMIGELLMHILINQYFDEYDVITPFFNMEERSIKKGYDVVLTEKNRAEIWLIEVKSGRLRKNKNANQTMLALLNTAKNDLKTRLNDENLSLWQEAINGAKLAYDANTNMKSAVVELLTKYGEDAVEGINDSKTKNVFVAGVLFQNLNDKVENRIPKSKQKKIEEENIFNKVYAISLQKETYQKVYEFIKEEADEKR